MLVGLSQASLLLPLLLPPLSSLFCLLPPGEGWEVRPKEQMEEIYYAVLPLSNDCYEESLKNLCELLSIVKARVIA